VPVFAYGAFITTVIDFATPLLLDDPGKGDSLCALRQRREVAARRDSITIGRGRRWISVGSAGEKQSCCTALPIGEFIETQKRPTRTNTRGVFARVGLLVNESPGPAGLPFI
jgi:hypothetical protein